jgi:hypothetical protein
VGSVDLAAVVVVAVVHHGMRRATGRWHIAFATQPLSHSKKRCTMQ